MAPPTGAVAQRPEQDVCAEVSDEEAHRRHVSAGTHLLRDEDPDAGKLALHRQVTGPTVLHPAVTRQHDGVGTRIEEFISYYFTVIFQYIQLKIIFQNSVMTL